jgi:quercetin dioxygenase-like cupin family protein
MPKVGQVLTAKGRETAEFLATAESTGGEYVQIKAVQPPGAVKAQPHVHLYQEESFQILAGRLTYEIGGRSSTAVAGEAIVTPPGTAHRHWNAEADEDLVMIQTLRPALDTDYFFETAYGLAREGKVQGVVFAVQGLVWFQTFRGTIAGESPPLWVQRALAAAATPLARLAGMRAVYRRFSGEEW